MLRTIERLILLFVVIVLMGCSINPAMKTRTYQLPKGDVSWEASTMVLEEEWQKHSVMSRAERRDDGVAVKTTPRGHRKIAEALKVRNQ